MNLRLLSQQRDRENRDTAPETIREQYENREKRFMSPFGCLSSASRGREQPEASCPVRTAFQRDRDRIVYSNAFRRLKYKTQVFLNPLGDVYRTRLTHTLEVAQMARNIARAMFLNEDLAEAIALGHDLGHTPFGHGGETALKEIYSPDFRHNEQSLRVVEFLENNGRGLNLTFEVRDGILKHSKGFGKVLPENSEKLPVTLEGRIVRFADIMAYLNHDLDDAVRSGVVREDQVPEACLRVLGRTHSERATMMIRDLIANSQAMEGEPVIKMSDTVNDAMLRLRRFLYENVYRSTRVHNEFVKAKKILSDLYSHFLENEPARQAELAAMDMDGCNYDRQPSERLVCDLLASMTDRYAMAVYRRIFFRHRWFRSVAAMDLNQACLVLARKHPDYFDRLAAVYGRMDAAYDAVAGHYGFVCNGCEDNCCLTRFRHHTLVEYAYLRQGFARLEITLRRRARIMAHDYRQALQDAEHRNALFRHWCPLNHDSRCILYAFRPMICRLHGLPHLLRHPSRGLIQGPGCHIFEKDCQSVVPRPLDRSDLYKALAGLEQTVRQGTGCSAPIGMTVADMILAFPDAQDA